MNTIIQCYWYSLSKRQRIDIYLEAFDYDLRCHFIGYDEPKYQLFSI